MAEADLPLILVVDDDRYVARSLAELLSQRFQVQAVFTAAAALEIVRQGNVGVILADQRMPGMGGVELLTEARLLQPSVIGVLITAHAEVDAAIRAINSAQVLGYLSKPWDEDELMLVLERAMDAHLALLQLARASHEPERELRLFERFSNGAPVPVTARRFGQRPISESLPDEFDQLAQRYTEILALALDQRTYKVDHQVGEALHGLADRLGSLGAGPRDVIDLHVIALRDRLAKTSHDESLAVAEEGRLLVLELMGHVVTYYRGYALGVRG